MKSVREKIESNYKWFATLTGFETQIGEVEFSVTNGYISIYPKGVEHFSENALTTLPLTCVESVVAFMQGALFIKCQGGTSRLNRKE